MPIVGYEVYSLFVYKSLVFGHQAKKLTKSLLDFWHLLFRLILPGYVVDLFQLQEHYSLICNSDHHKKLRMRKLLLFSPNF